MYLIFKRSQVLGGTWHGMRGDTVLSHPSSSWSFNTTTTPDVESSADAEPGNSAQSSDPQWPDDADCLSTSLLAWNVVCVNLALAKGTSIWTHSHCETSFCMLAWCMLQYTWGQEGSASPTSAAGGIRGRDLVAFQHVLKDATAASGILKPVRKFFDDAL